MLAPVFCRELVGETASASSPESLPTLTSLEQVHQLPAFQAQRHYPVRARGILISGPPIPVIQDATRGVYVAGWTNLTPISTLGDYYEVEGVTDPGGFSPIIKPTAIRHLGAGQLPQPRHPSLGEIKTGSEDAQWTELDAVVQQADSNVWQVAVQEGILRVRVAGATPEWCAALKGAVVRMQGVPLPVHNNHRQLLEVFFHVPSPECVCVQKPPLADPFQLPQTRAADLLRFNPLASLSQGVRVQGQVVHSQERMISIVDGGQGVKCFLEKPAALAPGDQVEVAGFPETGVFVPVLRQAKVRRLGPDSLPPPPVCSLEQLLTGSFDGTQVRVQGRLASQHTEGEEAILNLQMGPRLVAVRLPARRAASLELDLGSLLEVTATCNGLERDADGDAKGRRLRTFDLLVNSARDVRLLVKPSWWNIRHAFAVMAAAGIALLLAIAWIGSLRSEVASRTRVLEEEIETRKQTEVRLNREVEERARAQQEVERIHQELMLASRKAGMAEVATGVLHNVGNVLNSINVSATCAGDRIKRSRISGVQKLAALLREHAGDLAGFFARDDRARQLPGYVETLARSLETEQHAVIEELGNLRHNVEHVREIVSMQQAYARVGGVVESVQTVDLAKDALLINEPSFQRHQIRLRRDFDAPATLLVDRHKVLQILVNLLSNAKRACQDAGTNGHSEVVFRIHSPEQGRTCFEISDNGIGIPAENLTRIFVHGFTTHKDGHGFGLHNSALTAKELGGGLTVHSDGPGKGATFTLQLPNQPPVGDAKG
jgi:signal transduction histidine kinase